MISFRSAPPLPPYHLVICNHTFKPNTNKARELEIEHQTKIQTTKEKGLFKCDVRRDIDGATCQYACQSAAKLEEHKTKRVHMYPSMDVVDSAVDRAFNSMLCAGGRSNRSTRSRARAARHPLRSRGRSRLTGLSGHLRRG